MFVRFLVIFFMSVLYMRQYVDAGGGYGEQIEQLLTYEERGKEVVRIINSMGTTWKAKIARTFVGTWQHLGVQQVLGAKQENKASKMDLIKQPKKVKDTGKGMGPYGQEIPQDTSLPEHFDWREESDCLSLKEIRFQVCGDCWAVSSAAAFSDRYCLYTSKNKFFSSKQVSTCLYPWGGCDGGWPEDAMKYFVNNGLATGYDPNVLPKQPQSCIMYPPKLDSKLPCTATCDNGSPLDLTRGQDHRTLKSKNVTEIMHEIRNYGPVIAIFEVFEDFGYFGSNIYQHVLGKSEGGHAVRLIGWGVENGVPYWQCANQWGREWGEEGYFRILRGSNHVGIESSISSVYPMEALV